MIKHGGFSVETSEIAESKIIYQLKGGNFQKR